MVSQEESGKGSNPALVSSRVGGNGLAPWGFPVQLRPDPAVWEPPTSDTLRAIMKASSLPRPPILGVAQVGERMSRAHEAAGASPATQTNTRN